MLSWYLRNELCRGGNLSGKLFINTGSAGAVHSPSKQIYKHSVEFDRIFQVPLFELHGSRWFRWQTGCGAYTCIAAHAVLSHFAAIKLASSLCLMEMPRSPCHIQSLPNEVLTEVLRRVPLKQRCCLNTAFSCSCSRASSGTTYVHTRTGGAQVDSLQPRLSVLAPLRPFLQPGQLWD